MNEPAEGLWLVVIKLRTNCLANPQLLVGVAEREERGLGVGGGQKQPLCRRYNSISEPNSGDHLISDALSNTCAGYNN